MTGATAPAPKMDEVVCAHNFLGEGTKPILQATVRMLGARRPVFGDVCPLKTEPCLSG